MTLFQPAAPPATPPTDTTPAIGLGLLLLLATTAVYWRVQGFQFLAFDDNLYVTANPRVTSGLSWANLHWAFTTNWGNNWIPLTWLSHMLDCTLFGVAAGKHHLVNLLFHLLNTLLLFHLLRVFTRHAYPAALVAALFALHPLHVESVAWIAERKDLLSTSLGLFALYCYGQHAARPTALKYLGVLLFFSLALLAKPMLVTLPFLLLLLDYWPLRRWPARTARRLLAEKIPLFLLSAFFSYLTYQVQAATGAVASLGHYSWPVRIGNALASYLLYLGKTFWPLRLAVIYPHPGEIQVGLTVGAVLLLLLLTGLALHHRRRAPYLLVGWFWYLGSLVPVIGLVQVGNQALADRYTYLPLLGIFIIIAWGGRELGERWPQAKGWLGALAIAALLLLAFVTHRQIQLWANQKTLFLHALAVTGPNAMAEFQLATALTEEKKLAEAGDHFRAAIAYAPTFAKAHHNLGYVLEHQGQAAEAIGQYQEALRLAPADGEGHYNLGLLLMRQWRLEEAITHLRTATRLNPEFAPARANLARAERLRQATPGH